MSIDIVEAIRDRRSIREFTQHPVDDATLEFLLELAVLAPNHRMTEPWRFVVLGPEARRSYGRIKGERRVGAIQDLSVAETVQRNTIESMRSLPAIAGFVQRLDPDPEVREEDFATVYMGMQNFLLGAMARELGTHVKTGAILDDPSTREALGVAPDERLVALVHVGKPAKVPQAKPRTSSKHRTHWLP